MKNISIVLYCSFLLLLITAITLPATAQNSGVLATQADSLRGSITPQRAWWEVVYYDLNVAVMPEDSTISGYNNITYRVTDQPARLQVDLQDPLKIDQIKQDGEELSYERAKNSYAYFVNMPNNLQKDSLYTLSVYYQGKPKVAENPPWDGGFIWAQDSLGNPWIATANQGLGASVWWPNKDHQSAEPDSMSINITVPDEIKNVSNGRLRDTTRHDNGMTTWHWFISNPINNYNIAVNAGNYVNFSEIFDGEDGTLDLSYWVLEQNLDKAKKQFQQVKPMMRCFEDWFGPYPFYEDSFKLVETPHLGMEHQSAVAYGNQYQNGYMGRNLSGSGWGLKWDFIIIHEAAHEWWGNNITTNDIADMWVHEGFTSYSESIYTECRFGKEAAREYTIGLRANIENREPVTGQYGLNNEGSGDMYYKGHNMLHTIRQIVDNDSTWKEILRGINRDFRHQIVTADQVEKYIIEQSGKDLDDLFDQYLHYASIPVFQYYIDDLNRLHYRWKADISHFNMPLKIAEGKGDYYFIYPVSNRWKITKVDKGKDFKTDPNFYIDTERISNEESVNGNN
ncbi:M1 family metallopeptidase [Aliifodinibius salicampi]|uniref:M1 family metallopeptidase n=1 Tax=Fodinibius salicampi TaxID=1920655 RepID=A0ABT3PZJ0_9BACT|nr:M1 family metallopeptidase [Fodinibius salicampi]MCW9713191.1 M1 family metallopeptidase [Fodinibius salicampi]